MNVLRETRPQSPIVISLAQIASFVEPRNREGSFISRLLKQTPKNVLPSLGHFPLPDPPSPYACSELRWISKIVHAFSYCQTPARLFPAGPLTFQNLLTVILLTSHRLWKLPNSLPLVVLGLPKPLCLRKFNDSLLD